jgi:hypothetical protein
MKITMDHICRQSICRMTELLRSPEKEKIQKKRLYQDRP